MTGWDPDGAVLVVGHAIDPEHLADIRARLGGTEVYVLDLDADQPAGLDPSSADADPGADAEFPAESERAVALIADQVTAHPGITSLLSQSKWAARDIWRVVRPEPGLLGFTHIDNLERARTRRLAIDVTPFGRRRNSHRFSAEFAAPDVGWDPAARVRVLVGPGNEHGRAAGWARALRTLPGVDAIALSVGDDGFPAEVIATSQDWDTRTVRRTVLALVRGASHVLLDNTGTDPGPTEAVRSAAQGRVVEGTGLPAAVVPGLPAADPTHVVVVGADDAHDTGDPGDTGATALPGRRVTFLADVPRGLWVATAMTAGVIVDRRRPARLDGPVLSALARGAVLVGAPPAPGALRRPVPHLASLADPVLADPEALSRLRAKTRRHVQRNHGDQAVARQLRRALRIR